MSAVKLAIPDSRMFFVVSFEYRTEVLTIFRTFPLAAWLSFRIKFLRTIFVGKRSAEQSGTLSRGKSCLVEAAARWEWLIRPVNPPPCRLLEERTVSRTAGPIFVCTVCSSLRRMNKTVPREGILCNFCNKILQVFLQNFLRNDRSARVEISLSVRAFFRWEGTWHGLKYLIHVFFFVVSLYLYSSFLSRLNVD